jgi:O-antigen/teichoic acid export membrane protein
MGTTERAWPALEFFQKLRPHRFQKVLASFDGGDFDANRIGASRLSTSQSAVVALAIRVFGVACQTVTLMLLANKLSVTEMGIFATIYAIWMLARMLAPLGMESLALREIIYSIAKKQPDKASAVCQYAMRSSGLSGASLAVLVMFVLFIVNRSLMQTLSFVAILAIAAAVPAFSLVPVSAAASRAYGRNILAQAIESFGLHFMTLIGLSVLTLSTCLSLTSTIVWSCLCAWLTVVMYIRGLRRWTGPPGFLSAAEQRNIHEQGLEVWQAFVFIGFAAAAPTFLCAAILGPAATAILEMANRIGALPILFTTAVTTTYAPLITARLADSNLAGASENIAISTWLAFLPSAITFLFVLCCAPWLLSMLFPPAYQHAYVPLLFLTANATLNAAVGIAGSLLLLTGHQASVRYFSAVRLVIVVVGCALLALPLGVTGLTLAILLSCTVMDLGLARQCKPLLQVDGFLAPRGPKELLQSLRPK